MRQEHADAVAEEGRCDRNPIHGGVLQPHGGRLGGMNLGCGEFKISGTDVGLVRNRLAGGMKKCWEGEPSLKLARETRVELTDRKLNSRADWPSDPSPV